MILFPNCKINLGLNITRKRNDGYHDLETVFYPLPFTDALEIVRADQHLDTSAGQINTSFTDVQFSSSGLDIPGDPALNLCIKAYRLLQQKFSLPPVRMHLHKTIPMGAGLGGGSSDAAFCLRLLNDKFQLSMNTGELLDAALQLGSDCPFFIINKPAFATGRGEILRSIELDLSSYHFLLVHPNVHVSTAAAFAEIQPSPWKQQLQDVIKQPIEDWRDHLLNDFEAPIFNTHPELRDIKSALYDAGALYASMSGSGSSFYGIFRERPADLVQQLSGRYSVSVHSPAPAG